MSSFSSLIRRIRRNAAAIVTVMVVGAVPLASPVVTPALADTSSAASTPGYWLVASDGGIFAFGSAKFFGSTGAIHLNQPITGMAPTPDGNGYWLVASDGGIFAFGAAGFFGSTGAIKLNKPITGMSTSASGKGYRMVASDGGVFSFGDAAFYGSTGGQTLAKPISSMAPTPDGAGYWMVASDGGIFPFGDAVGFGGAPSVPSTHGPRAIAAMVPSPSGAGYWEASTTGELIAFGDATNLGGVSNLSRPIVGMAAVPSAASGGTGGTGGTGTGGAGGTTPTTAPAVILPPGQLPQTVSINSRFSFGTPPDPTTVSSTKSGQELSQIVRAVVESGTDFYMSGEFTNLVDPSKTDPTGANSDGLPVSPAIPYLAQMDVSTGAPTAGSAFNAAVAPSCKSTTGVIPCRVSALATSPDGKTLYVGGNFDTIGGGKAPKLAAINTATGLLDPAFNAPALTSEVEALVLRGNVLYIGGAFRSVQGTPRPGIAALDATTGGLIDSFVNQSGPTPLTAYDGHYSGQGGTPVTGPGNVHTLALTGDGSTLVVGGDFLNIGTTPLANPLAPTHGGIITLDASVTAAAPAGTGNLTTWQPTNPGSSHQRPAYQVTASPADPKTFYAAEGGVGGEVVAWTVGNTASGAPDWIQHVDGDGDGVAATSQRVYFGGHYGHVVSAAQQCTQVPCNVPGGTKSNQLAAFDLKGTFDNTWTAQADTPKGPDDLWIGPHGLYVGGGFFGVAPTPNPNGHNSYNNQPGLAIFPPAS